eukprot:s1961_g15.t1
MAPVHGATGASCPPVLFQLDVAALLVQPPQRRLRGIALCCPRCRNDSLHQRRQDVSTLPKFRQASTRGHGAAHRDFMWSSKKASLRQPPAHARGWNRQEEPTVKAGGFQSGSKLQGFGSNAVFWTGPAMLLTRTETRSIQSTPSFSDSQASNWKLPATVVGRAAGDLSAASEPSEVQTLQERMAPWKSLWLVNYLVFLLVLNVEIVVPTADQYAQTLGAGETFSGLVQSLLEEYSSAARK